MSCWYPVSISPGIPAGTRLSVIVAVQGCEGYRVCEALYACDSLVDTDAENTWRRTGYFERHRDTFDDDYYEPLLGVAYWQPMPEPPEQCEHCV